MTTEDSGPVTPGRNKKDWPAWFRKLVDRNSGDDWRDRHIDALHDAVYDLWKKRVTSEQTWETIAENKDKEIERLRALLKDARLHATHGWDADRTKGQWLADIDAALRGEGKP